MEISSEQNLTKKPSDDTTRKEEVLGGQGKGRGEEEVGAHCGISYLGIYI